MQYWNPSQFWIVTQTQLQYKTPDKILWQMCCLLHGQFQKESWLLTVPLQLSSLLKSTSSTQRQNKTSNFLKQTSLPFWPSLQHIITCTITYIAIDVMNDCLHPPATTCSASLSELMLTPLQEWSPPLCPTIPPLKVYMFVTLDKKGQVLLVHQLDDLSIKGIALPYKLN